MRKFAKSGLDLVAGIPFLQWASASVLKSRINILYYHYVGSPPPHYASFYTGCTLERFERHLGVLDRYFEFRPLKALLDGEQPMTNRHRPQLAITFDDGFDLIRSGVARALNRFGISATAFVVTNNIDNRSLMWMHKLSAIRVMSSEKARLASFNQIMAEYNLPLASEERQILALAKRWPMAQKDDLAQRMWEECGLPDLEAYLMERKPYFTLERLRQWIDQGHSVGLHSASHPVCSGLDANAINLEVVEPAKQLVSWGVPGPVPFSYPFGIRMSRDMEASLYRQGVYSCALGVGGFSSRPVEPYRIERMPAESYSNYYVFAKPFLAKGQGSD